jgi:hypothetical protein
MNAFRNIAAAALFGFGFASAASAEEWTGPRVVGTGENASVVYSSPSQNIVGGALTRTVGSGESATTEVIAVQHTNPGHPTRVVGSGESSQLIFLDASAAQAGQRG